MKRSDIKRLKTRAVALRKLAKQSRTKVGRHIAEQMAGDAEKAVTKAEADQATKH